MSPSLRHRLYVITLNKPFVGWIACVIVFGSYGYFLFLFPVGSLIIRWLAAFRTDELCEIVNHCWFPLNFDVLNVMLCRKARIRYLESLINSGYSYAP